MKKMCFMRGCLMVLFLLAGWEVVFAGQKVFDHQVDQPFSGSQSPEGAYVAAVARAKSEVLDMAGTYLESLTVVENSMLARDEVTALASGILKTEIIDRQNYATPKTFGMILQTRIEVDTDILEQRVQKLLEDRTLLRKYNEIQQREQELLTRIRQLEQQNRLAAAQPVQLSAKFAELSAALTASQWHEKAIKLWDNGRYSDPQQAIIFLNKAIELDAENAHIYNNRAGAYLNLAQYAAAKDDLSHALTLNADYADAHNNLGSLYYQQQHYAAAVAAYSRAIELQPQFAEAIMNRGMASRKLFHYEAAFDDFRLAMSLPPEAIVKKIECDGSRVRLNEMDQLCAKAQTSCDMGLCRALNFLQQRGFCQSDVDH